MSGPAGVGKVLAQDVIGAAAGGAPAEQLALLPDPAPAAAKPEPAAAAEGEGGIGKGRPPGARNRRTDEMVRYLNTFGQGPLVGLARIVNAIRFNPATGLPDFAELARALGMETAAAATFWAACADKLAPYMHQKLPIAVDLKTSHDGDLLILNRGAVQGDAPVQLDQLPGHLLGDLLELTANADESEENQ